MTDVRTTFDVIMFMAPGRHAAFVAHECASNLSLLAMNRYPGHSFPFLEAFKIKWHSAAELFGSPGAKHALQARGRHLSAMA